MKNTKHYGFKNKYFTFDYKKLTLVIPFIILSLVLVVIPLIFIFIKSFIPVDQYSVGDNFNFMFSDGYIFSKIFWSIFVAIIVTFFCVLFAFPFTYLLSRSDSSLFKSTIILIATAPIWTSFLVKLVGLKTFFDVMNGYKNSTFGDIYTIIGLIYLYIPFMLSPLYSTLITMPKNLLWASWDLGYGPFTTFFKVVVPYTFPALISGISLVFLPSLTTVAVPQFLNNSSDGSMIGDIIVDEGNIAGTSKIALARVSALSMTLLIVLVIGYFGLIYGRKLYKIIKGKFNDNYGMKK